METPMLWQIEELMRACQKTLKQPQKAINLGCDFVEIDVRCAKDGRIVSILDTMADKYVSPYN
jgi:glycerophosphoryl diester phosphodiesterase